MLYSYTYDTPIGKISLTADESSLKRLDFGTVLHGEERETELIKLSYNELLAYFSNKRRSFSVPLSPDGTEFQKSVWDALSKIPFGETRTYGEIAKSLGKPEAARAVGSACNKNPIAIVIPCHRVVGKSGSLTGYAGGLSTKAALLDLEKTAPRLFSYGETELKYLKFRDDRLSKLIDSIPCPEYEIIPDLFEALVYNIMGQQISMKAAETVWRRLKEKFVSITPDNLLSVPIDELQSVGISMRKASYIRGAAEKFLSGELFPEALRKMPDEQVCKELEKLRGVGRWTAEMLMIFSMERRDILSFDDLGIRRGIMRLHGLEKLDRESFEYYRGLYSPYGTVASFYLWSLND